ncbi:tetratricopeptide repeat protein [Thermodesulfobacteriota bacterium]
MKVIFPIYPLLVIFLLVAPVYAGTANNVQSLLEEARTILAEKQYSRAIPLFEKVIADDMSYPEAYSGLIKAYSGTGDLQGGIIAMESLFLEYPNKAEVHYGLGYGYFMAKKYDRALEHFHKSLVLKPDFAESLNNCAVIYHTVKSDIEKAREYYDRAVTVSERTGNKKVQGLAEKNLALLPPRLVPFTGFLTLEEFINRIVAGLDGDSLKGTRELIMGQRQNSQQAMEWFITQAMQARVAGQQNEEETVLVLADFLAREFKVSFDSDQLTKRLQQFHLLSTPDMRKLMHGETLVEQGRVYHEQERYQAAQESFRAAARLFAEVDDQKRAGRAWLYLGDTYLKGGLYREAWETLDKAVALAATTGEKDNQALGLTFLGIACARLIEYDRAVEYFIRAAEMYRVLGDEGAAHQASENIKKINQMRERKQ